MTLHKHTGTLVAMKDFSALSLTEEYIFGYNSINTMFYFLHGDNN